MTPARTAADWQPIATAPKDGTWVIVGFWSAPDTFLVFMAAWQGDRWNPALCDYQIGPTHWQPIEPPEGSQ